MYDVMWLDLKNHQPLTKAKFIKSLLFIVAERYFPAGATVIYSSPSHIASPLLVIHAFHGEVIVRISQSFVFSPLSSIFKKSALHGGSVSIHPDETIIFLILFLLKIQ